MNGVIGGVVSRRRRLAGAIVDIAALAIITVPFMLFTGIQKNINNTTLTQKVLLFIILNIAFFLLNGYLLLKKGQTVGKLAVKTKIVDLNGQIPSFLKIIFFRYLIFSAIYQFPVAGAIISLINPLFIFGDEHRCLHDYVAGTYVIDYKDIS